MFLPKVLEQTIEAESPRQFFFWAALTAISAVLKRRCYFDRYNFKVYPNIYVFLVAKSGLRKGLPPHVMARLVNSVNNTRVIEGRFSVQALIQDLSRAWHVEGSNKPITDACAYVNTPELAASLIEDPQAMSIMTDLYDSQYHDKWKNRLKGTGLESLEHPTLTWLGASNPELLKSVITGKEIHGGFVGRTFLIGADRRNTTNALVDEPEHYIKYNELAEELREVSRLEGRFTFDDDAKDYFKKWYHQISDELNEDTTGTYERLDTHVLKISMLLQAGRHCNLLITEETLREAIELCVPLIKTANNTASTRGRNQLADIGLKFVQELMLKPEVGRAEILRKLWKDVTAIELDQIIEALEQAGTTDHIIRDGKVFYRLSSEFRKSLGAK